MVVVPLFVLGQDFLVLDKMGTKKRIEYFVGDPIKYRLIDEKVFRTDEILSLTDSTILFSNGLTKFSHIAAVEHSTPWMRSTGITLIVAGIGYVFIDRFNQMIQGDGLSYDEKVMRSGAILTGSGVALLYFSRRRVKIRKNWRLRLVDIY